MLLPRLRTPRLALELLRATTTTTASPGLRRVGGARRGIHHVPSLPHDYSQGVPNLMSPAGFALAWTDYMGLMIEKLNALTAGTDLEDKDTKTIALMTAREPGKAPIFNYASMAHNNHFFFQGIAPAGTPMPEVLRTDLANSFSSVETLRREFVATAAAMFGPGFLWLVKAGHSDYRLLPTYLAGSPYPGAHWRAQSADMNTLGADGSARSFFRNQASAAAPARKRAGDLPPGGIELQPLLCLNTWEHAWLLDWGVGVGGAGGKTAFVESWWELIDWEKVADRADVKKLAFKSSNAASG